MKYQYSSVLDANLSYLGLGTVKLGRNQGVKYPQGFNLPSDADAKKLLSLAHDLGINVLDTAPAYGESEVRLGGFLKGWRDDWLIVSKAGETFTAGQSFFDFSPPAIMDSVKQSLKRLNTDYIDILLVHSDGRDEEIIYENEVFVTLKKLKQEGYIRSFGMSVKTVAGGLATLKEADCVMVALNPEDTSCEAVVQSELTQDKLVLIKKAFASGHLYTGDKALTSQDIFNFLQPYEAISSVIIGTINPYHLKENVKALSGISS